jgi:signal transduction histidine kinase/ligand-binding sensor domain-containing protein/DNA-binding response OmpR family regulator
VRVFVTIILILFIGNSLYAQTNFHQLNQSNGLASNSVQSITKDENGFLWMAVPMGLQRYDGTNVVLFPSIPALNEFSIQRIINAPGNYLLLQLDNGWALFNLNTYQYSLHLDTYLKKLGLPEGEILEVFLDNRKRYWFSIAREGVFLLNGPEEKVKKIELDTVNITSIAEDPNGAVWLLGNDARLFQLHQHTNALIQQQALKANKNTLQYSMFIDQDFEFWFYCKNNPIGLYRYHLKNDQLIHYTAQQPASLNTDLVVGVIQADANNIWIATDHGGINVYNKTNNRFTYIKNDLENSKSLAQNSITSFLKDDLGIIWIGTYKKGLSYYHPHFQQFPLYRTLNSNHTLPFEDVNRFVEDEKGNLWIGTNGGGLLYFNRTDESFKTYQFQKNKNSISNDVIVSLAKSRHQDLWIGTFYGGLDRFDGKQFYNYRHQPGKDNSISDNKVWEILEDHRGQIWIGTLNGGLNLYQPQTQTFKYFSTAVPNTLTSNYISVLKEDHLKRIWVGGIDGVAILTPINNDYHFQYLQHQINDPLSLMNNHVFDLLEDHQGNIWIATRDGISIFTSDLKKIKDLKASDGLADNICLTILEDDQHHIWVGSPKGLSRIIWKHENGHLRTEVSNFDAKDGLQGNSFNENAALKLKSGELIFGGANGFNLFHPEKIVAHATAYPIYLTELRWMNNVIHVNDSIHNRILLKKTLNEIDTLVLKYNENFFSISFTIPDYFNADKIKFYYQLDGLHNDWIRADELNRTASFTNVDPGSYQLKIKTEHSNEVRSLYVIIKPPFWKTPLAYFLYALIAAGILYLARRRIIRKAHRAFQETQYKQSIEQKLQLDQMKIQFFTNVSHEFRTPLSLIIAPIDNLLKTDADTDHRRQYSMIHKNAKRLLNLVNQLLDFRKMETNEIRLNAVEDDIIPVIRESVDAFHDLAVKKQIQYIINDEVKHLITKFDAEKIERILFNVISNAFKFTPTAGTIQVNIVVDGQELVIEVEDTGIGIAAAQIDQIFEPFFQQKQTAHQGSGIGLSITKEFVELHQGTITCRSIENQGSKFIIRLPLKAGFSLNTVISAAAHSNEKTYTVLIVEDNDDFRFYLKDNLRHHFNILEAVDGMEAWKKAMSHSPDLIVSDISMPMMDGIELCKKIKANKKTSHIPVVLLTAASSEELELRGLDIGASDFLTKPFNFQILISRINTLLKQQTVMQKTYSKRLSLPENEVTVSDPDQLFLTELIQLVEKEMSNAAFSVEDMSRKMHMSRVSLYKKIVALTGLTPLLFLRQQRMLRAKQLLEKTNMTVAEIAYEAGYNNPKYFTKHFKQHFQILPSDYQNKYHRNSN